MKKTIFTALLLSVFVSVSFSQILIPDNTLISGLWASANSPYIIEGRAIVPNGQTLTIEPGVEIKLKSSASQTPSWFDYAAGNVGVLRVQGELIANGTKDNPIVFTRNNNGFWGTILIEENTSVNSSFTNCIIEYAKEIRNVPGIISPTSFNGGISIYKTTIIFHENEIKYNSVNGIFISEVNPAFEISDNRVHNNGSTGLVIEQSAVNAVNNTFYENSLTSTGSVSAIRSANSTAYLIGNLIYDNDDFGIYTTSGGNNFIINNTIYNNSNGIRVESGANTFIYNTIIQNNSINFATSDAGGASIEMQFSLTDDADYPENISDIAGNIPGSDALFINAGENDFGLQAGSPCINAGNPDTIGLRLPGFDLEGFQRISAIVVDIGCYENQDFVAPEQTLILPQGWSSVSTSLKPYFPSLDSMFNACISQMVILKNMDGVFWPEQNINTLMDWDFKSGYLIKMNEAVSIPVRGNRITNKTLDLLPGWNLVPVMSPCGISSNEVLDQLGDNLVIIKEPAGIKVFWPGLNIDTLDALAEGKAYFVMVGSAAQLTFPDCSR